MMERRRALMAMQTGGLPQEYKRVEYIESTGTQYIDSGIVPTINTGWFVDFSDFDGMGNMYTGVGGSGTTGCWINVSVRTDTYTRSYASFGNVVDMGFDTGTNDIGKWNIGRHSIDLSKDGVLMDGIDVRVRFTNVTFAPNNDTLCICARMKTGIIERYIKAKIFNNEIRSNGILVSQMIPCIRKSDNKPGMYDAVRKTFYTNAGTGEFIVPA